MTRVQTCALPIFSHTSDEFFPSKDNGKLWTHEEYSTSIIRNLLGETILSDKAIIEQSITLSEITELITGGSPFNRNLFWKQLISSPLDSDRMDYLLRDSYFTGTRYGIFDIERVIESINIGEQAEDGHITICIEEGGKDCAIAMIIARYFAFKQIYYHKLRRGFDTFLREVIKLILAGGKYPSAEPESISDFIHWDDWKIISYIYNLPDCPIKRMFMNRNKPHVLCSTNDKSQYDKYISLFSTQNGYYTDIAPDKTELLKKDIFIRGKKVNELGILSATPLIGDLNISETYYIYCMEEDKVKFNEIMAEATLND